MGISNDQLTTIAPKPVPVSSTSSIDTNVSGIHDTNRSAVIQYQNIAPSEVVTPPITPQTHSLSENLSLPGLPFNSVGTLSSLSLDRPPAATSLLPGNHLHISPSTGVVVPAMASTNTVPEFLYQLTKMLTDNNRDVIEWSNGA